MFAAPRLLLLTGPESLILAGSGAVLGAVLAAHFRRWSFSSARLVGAVAAAFVASTLIVAPRDRLGDDLGHSGLAPALLA